MEEAAPLAPQAAALPAAPPKRAAAAARRRMLCDITNSRHRPGASGGAGAAGGGDVARLIEEKSALARLLEEKEEIIELSSAELQKLRLANWQLAQANSLMLAELNLGRQRLKALQHQLACSRAALKARTLESEGAKTLTKKYKHHQERTSEMLEGDIAPEPTSDAPHPASVKACNPSRKRMLRSQSLGPAIPIKQIESKENVAQRRKSLRTRNNNNNIAEPEAEAEGSDHTEDLFELEDVKLAIRSSKVKSDASLATGEGDPTRMRSRSSLGRPLRRAAQCVASYKETPVNIKMRRS